MKTSTLRAVDQWIGLPACLLLTLHRWLLGGSAPAGPVRRILFVKLAEQGSTVLAEEALRSAIARVGSEHVFFLAFAENRFILDAMDLIPGDNVLTLDATSLATVTRSTISVLRRLRALRIDAAVDLEFFARSSAIFSYLSGARQRVGLHSYAGEGPSRGNLLTHRLLYNPYLHTSQLFLLLVEALDCAANRFPAFPRVPPRMRQHGAIQRPAAEDVAAVARLLRDCTRQADVPPIILLNANCGDLLPLRRWDSGRYVGLARRLLDARPEVYVAFTGNSNEAAEADRLAAAVSSPRCVSLAGRTTLRELLALYSLSQVLVTNDSGPAHFATLTPIDVVTLFGPETPALFAAQTPRNHVLWAGIACSPCVSAFNNRLSTCQDNVCMQQLTVDQVFEVTISAYTSRLTAPSSTSS